MYDVNHILTHIFKPLKLCIILFKKLHGPEIWTKKYFPNSKMDGSTSFGYVTPLIQLNLNHSFWIRKTFLGPISGTVALLILFWLMYFFFISQYRVLHAQLSPRRKTRFPCIAIFKFGLFLCFFSIQGENDSIFFLTLANYMVRCSQN